MIEIIGALMAIVFCWLAMFFYGMEYGSGKTRFFKYGVICLMIGEIPLMIRIVTWRIIFAPTLEGNVILIIISVIYLAIAFGLGYVIGRRIKSKEKRKEVIDDEI